MIYDITRTITTQTAVWDGDTHFQVQHNVQIADGASINLTTLTMSPHTGTHADAYYHYRADGAHPAQMPLEHYVGPALVVETDRLDGGLTVAEIEPQFQPTERLLIRSNVSEQSDNVFPRPFPYLTVELIEWLAARDVVLIGLDSPSVDDYESKMLPCHHALQAHGMVNLELLQLRDVPAGHYDLTALPLKMDAVCGSPVRAILRAR